MHKLSIDFQLQPFGQLRSNIGCKIITAIIHIRITQDTVFIVITARNIVLSSFTTTTQTDVVVLLECPILVVQIEIVYITQTRFRVFEGRVHTSVGCQFKPWIHTSRVFAELLVHSQLFVAIQTSRTSIAHTIVPISSKIIRVDHIRQYGWSIPTYSTLIIDTHFAFFSLLGSNKNYTVCSTCTINSSRGSIFQYRNRFNIIRVYIRKAHFNTIYQYVWSRTTRKVTLTTQTQRTCSTWTTSIRIAY